MVEDDEEGNLEDRIRYTSVVKGDKVDAMFEDFVNEHNVKLPIKRIEEGKYLFGT